LRREETELVLECSTSNARVEFLSSKAHVWACECFRPFSLPDASDASPRACFIDLLAQHGFLERIGKPEAPERATWEFHDLLLHRESRYSDRPREMGGTYRFTGRFPSPPAFKEAMSEDVVALPEHDPAVASRPLVEVMEARRSTREFDDENPITRLELAQLLGRIVQARRGLESQMGQECLMKPVPSGGGIHELELYLAVRLCDGLDTGLYHYRPDQHVLEALPETHEGALRITEQAGHSMGRSKAPPQVVCVFASRLSRLAWKYKGIAYRVTLLNAGVLIQSFYLHATDLGLAVCALGSGNSDAFAEASGLDPLAEPSVAELALGSRCMGE